MTARHFDAYDEAASDEWGDLPIPQSVRDAMELAGVEDEVRDCWIASRALQLVAEAREARMDHAVARHG